MIAFMRFSLLLVLLGLTLAPSVASAQPSDSSDAARLREAITVFNEIMSAEDQSIPRSIITKAEGIAIFPNTIKGGFIVGAQRGRGGWREGRAEGRGEGAKVQRVDLAVVVEVASAPRLVGLIEARRQASEVERVGGAVQVRVADRGVADQDAGAVDG